MALSPMLSCITVLVRTYTYIHILLWYRMYVQLLHTYASPVHYFVRTYVINTPTLLFIVINASNPQERRVFFAILRDVFVGVVDHTQLEELVQEIHPPPATLLSRQVDNSSPLSTNVSVLSPTTAHPAVDGEDGRVQVMEAIAREAQLLGLLLHQPWMSAVAQVHTALCANHGGCRL